MASTRRTPPPRHGRRSGSLRVTEWAHVVLAMLVTLLALGSWAWVAGGESSPEQGAVASGPFDPGGEPTEPEERPLRNFSIAASGDILIHGPVAERAIANGGSNGYDFGPMFRHVAPIISEADLAICHMETPISIDNSDVASYPIFNAPREVANALAEAGYDLCSTASNHSFDKGSDGVRKTIKALKRAGLRHEGTATNPKEAEKPEIFEVNDVTLGHLSYTYGLNGFTLPAGEEYLVNVLDVKKILKEARRARSLGAEFVVVSLHWGLEFQTAPTEDQLAAARRLLKSPAVDLILGHHAHVVQPVQKVKDEFVVYGMGNFLSNQRPGATATCCLPETQDGLLAEVEIQETEKGWKTKVAYHPTWVAPGSYEILPVARALQDGSFSSFGGDLRASWDRTVATVNSLGARRWGVRPAEKP